MKKRNKYIFFVLFISFIILGISSYFSFFRKVVFYKPFRIEFQGLNIIEFSGIQCTGYSPYDKEFKFSGNLVAYSIISPNYVHCKEITLFIPDEIFRNIKSISYYSGNKKQEINLNKDKAVIINNPIKRGHDILLFNLSEFITQNNSVIGLYVSTISWAGKYFCILLFIAALFILILIILNLRFYRTIKDKALQSIALFFNNLIHKKHKRLIITLILFSVLTYLFFNISSFKGAKLDMNDMAFHSAGVNFAKGHGISRFGTIEPIDTYNFSVFRNNLEFHYRFITRFAGLYYYYNAPAYGLFLGIIYYLSDCNIYLAKAIQLFMLLIIASCLPLLGYRIWKGAGFLCGILASFIFLNKFHIYADRMDAQVLMIFVIFLSVICHINFIHKASLFKLILLALSLSLACLTKVSIILYPVFIILYFLYNLLKKKEKKYMYFLVLFLICFLVPIFIWSWYASTHKNSTLFGEMTSKDIRYELLDSPLSHKDSLYLNSIYEKKPFSNRVNVYISMDGYKMTYEEYNKAGADVILPSVFNTDFIFITSQNKNNSLFFFHNEYINKNSTYSAAWLNDSNSFYLNDHLNSSPDWLRVLNFYFHNPVKIILLPLHKLYKSFGKNIYLYILILCFIVNTLLFVIFKNKVLLNKYLKLFLFLLINPILLLPVIYNPNPLMFYFLIFLFVCCFIFVILKKYDVFFKMPLAFFLIIASQLILTILISGNERYTEMLDFIFILNSLFGIYFINKTWIFTESPDLRASFHKINV